MTQIFQVAGKNLKLHTGDAEKKVEFLSGVDMSKVINFEEKRRDSIEKRKRNFERVLFTEFLGSYAEIDDNGTKYGVNLVDISREGCMFQVPFAQFSNHRFKDGEDITVRVYFTKEDFLPRVRQGEARR